MLELMAYLRAREFKTFIVSGGGIEFMRAVDPEGLRHPARAGGRVLGGDPLPDTARTASRCCSRSPRSSSSTTRPGKAVGINRFIGRRPIFAFGNSDGDKEMLEWTAAGSGERFMGLVHHDDAVREWAYDRHSHIGKLDKALDEANATRLDRGQHEAGLAQYLSLPLARPKVVRSR